MVNIGLLGMGTIGSGAFEQINSGRGNFAESAEIPAVITKVLDKNPNIKADNAIVTNNPADILEDDSIEIVIALMGGLDFEYEQIKEALKHKKHVVTANKAVIGAHFKELTELAKENGVMLRYEASVGGGIPIIKSLERELRNNDVTEISGILNGTSNFILTKILKARTSFSEALKEAQAVGFAEANPEADIEGDDVSRKIAILSSLAYKDVIKDEDVKKRGISNIKQADILETNRLGYRIKHLGQSINDNGNVSIVVEPVLIRKQHPMSAVIDEFNLISIKGNVIDELQFYGRGAGKDATANAVVNDVLDIISAIKRDETIEQPVFDNKLEVMGNDLFTGEYYLRLDLENSKNIGLADLMQRLEEVVDIKRIYTSDGNIFVVTREVASPVFDAFIEGLGLPEDEYFYARIFI